MITREQITSFSADAVDLQSAKPSFSPLIGTNGSKQRLLQRAKTSTSSQKKVVKATQKVNVKGVGECHAFYVDGCVAVLSECCNHKHIMEPKKLPNFCSGCGKDFVAI